MKASNESNELVKSALHHLVEQEHAFFNPHLHPVGDVHYSVFGLALPVVALFGVVANAVVYATLARKRPVQSLSLLLQCLAGYDVAVCLISVWTFALPTLCQAHGWLHDYMTQLHPMLVPYLMASWHMAVTGSDYLNLAAAVERYLALDRHFRKEKCPHSGCSPRRTVVYIVVILAFTVAFNLPSIFERSAVPLESDEHVLEVVPTDLRFHDVYVKMYRLMAEFLIFKVTPWISFLILALSLKDRIKYNLAKGVRKTLTSDHYLELMDSRIILGINALFYLTNAMLLYISFSHIILHDVSDDEVRIGYLLLVANSALKFLVYVSLSRDFRRSLKALLTCGGGRRVDRHWTADVGKSRSFLHHTKVAALVQSESKPNVNVCYTNGDEGSE